MADVDKEAIKKRIYEKVLGAKKKQMMSHLVKELAKEFNCDKGTIRKVISEVTLEGKIMYTTYGAESYLEPVPE